MEYIMEMPTSYVITLLNSQGEQLLCQAINGEHLGFNSRYCIYVEGESPFPLLAEDFHHCTVNITTRFRDQFFFCGKIINLTQGVHSQARTQFKLCFGSPMFEMDNEHHERTFSHVSIQDILREILSIYDFHVDLNIEDTSHTIEYISQAGLSDYDFLIRLCRHYGVVFYHRFEEGRVKIQMTDRVQHVLNNTIAYNPDSQMVEQKPSITNMSSWQVKVSDKILLRESKPDNPHIVFKHQTNNKTSIPGQGTLEVSNYYALHSQQDCIIFAERLQQQVDWQRQWVQIEGHDLMLLPSEVIYIGNHPGISSKQKYQLIDSSFSLNISGSSLAHGLKLDAYVIPMEHPYRMPELLTVMNWPKTVQSRLPQCLRQLVAEPCASLTLSELQGEKNQFCHDEHGNYVVQHYFERQSQEKKSDITSVRQLYPSANCHVKHASGMHFPLKSNTRVITTQNDNLLNRPLVLGVVPDIEQPSPVTKANRQSTTLAFQSNVTLSFLETTQTKIMALYTQKYKHGLLFNEDKSKAIIQVMSEGILSFQGEEALSVQCGENIKVKSSRAFVQSKKEVGFISLKDMIYQGKVIEFNAENDWLCTSLESSLILKAQQDFMNISNGVDLKASSLDIVAESGHLIANPNLVLHGQKRVSFEASTCKLMLASGHIGLESTKISLTAGMVIKNQGVYAPVLTK